MITDVIEHVWLNCLILDYRKLSFFQKIQPIQKPNSALTPTTLQLKLIPLVEDYGLKASIRIRIILAQG